MSPASKNIFALTVLALLALVTFAIPKDGYKPSDQRLFVSELVKNPYKFRGQSGIIDPTSMVFDHMAGDNSAIYRMIGFPLALGDQVAVDVSENTPPLTTTLWRVYIEGTGEFKNGFGATIHLPQIRFEGLYVPPSKQSEGEAPSNHLDTTRNLGESDIQQQQPLAYKAPIHEETAPTKTTSENQNGTQDPAPIERVHVGAGSLYECETNTHHIVIDRLEGGAIRYRSWNSAKSLTDKPDIEVPSGSESIEGSGVCSRPVYSFKTGDTTFEVQALGCTDGSEPAKATGRLNVFVSARQITDTFCY